MAWLLPRHPFRTFQRNSLALVVAQLRFQPILKIAQNIAGFQDRVRPRFPGYESVELQEIEINTLGSINVMRNEAAHKFTAAGTPAGLSMGTSSFSVEYAKHKDRNDLLSDVKVVLAALNDIYAPVIPTRLGLRYVNIIQRRRISDDLKRDIAWKDLLAAQFTSVPGGVTTLDDDTHFMAEVSSPCERGKMTLRYGVPISLPTGATRNSPNFRVDTDRFIEGEFRIEDVPALLESFSADIFDLFMSAAGPALLEWMSASKGKGD